MSTSHSAPHVRFFGQAPGRPFTIAALPYVVRVRQQRSGAWSALVYERCGPGLRLVAVAVGSECFARRAALLAGLLVPETQQELHEMVTRHRAVALEEDGLVPFLARDDVLDVRPDGGQRPQKPDQIGGQNPAFGPRKP